MANTDIVTGAKRNIFIGDIKENRPVSENLNNKIAGNIQYILERLSIKESFIYPGYFNNETPIDNGAGGIIRLDNSCKVKSYNLAIRSTGSSGTTQFNLAVYDSLGVFVNNLFSTAPSISGNNGVNVVIGREGLTTLSPSAFATNTGGHTIDQGTLSLGITSAELLAGYILVPFIVSNAEWAYNLTFNLRLEEL